MSPSPIINARADGADWTTSRNIQSSLSRDGHGAAVSQGADIRAFSSCTVGLRRCSVPLGVHRGFTMGCQTREVEEKKRKGRAIFQKRITHRARSGAKKSGERLNGLGRRPLRARSLWVSHDVGRERLALNRSHRRVRPRRTAKIGPFGTFFASGFSTSDARPPILGDEDIISMTTMTSSV